MIRGIGIDIAEISRFRHLKDKKRFLEQVLTEKEIIQSHKNSDRDSYYAMLFAAKEALFKALGTGLRLGSYWHDVQIGEDFAVELSGCLNTIAREQGISYIHVATSHTRHHAVALVVAEGLS